MAEEDKQGVTFALQKRERVRRILTAAASLRDWS